MVEFHTPMIAFDSDVVVNWYTIYGFRRQQFVPPASRSRCRIFEQVS